jgi:hypothetical protein
MFHSRDSRIVPDPAADAREYRDGLIVKPFHILPVSVSSQTFSDFY